VKAAKPTTVDEYIAGFPTATQQLLMQLRDIIRKHAPKAVEKISYGMPAYHQNGRNVIYFAGYKEHVAVYPAPRENEQFKKLLSAYKGGKGTVQFPLTEPLPVTVIAKIVKFRVDESSRQAAARSVRKRKT